MTKIQDPSSFETKSNYIELSHIIVKHFEDLVFAYEEKKIHRLAFYAILRTQGQIFIEIEDYKNAIMVFKALKNLCKKWQMDEIYLLKHNSQGSSLMSNTRKFAPHIMTLYN